MPGQVQRRTSGRSHRELPAGRFHLIVLDPPFGDAVDPLLGAVATRLESGGVVYIERPKADGLPSLAGLRWHRRGRAGAVEFGLATPD
jgi:16S rRNA G966 N2-methylase RsmD